MTGTGTHHVNILHGLARTSELIETLGPAEKDLSVTHEDDVLGVNPTGVALASLGNILPPQIVECPRSIGTDVVRLAGVKDVGPTEGPDVIADTALIAEVLSIRSDDRHLKTGIPVLVCPADTSLVALVEIVLLHGRSTVTAVVNHVLVTGCVPLGGGCDAPVSGSRTVLQTVAEEEDYPLELVEILVTGAIFLPVEVGSVSIFETLDMTRVGKVVVPCRSAGAAVSVVDGTGVALVGHLDAVDLEDVLVAVLVLRTEHVEEVGVAGGSVGRAVELVAELLDGLEVCKRLGPVAHVLIDDSAIGIGSALAHATVRGLVGKVGIVDAGGKVSDNLVVHLGLAAAGKRCVIRGYVLKIDWNTSKDNIEIVVGPCTEEKTLRLVL